MIYEVHIGSSSFKLPKSKIPDVCTLLEDKGFPIYKPTDFFEKSMHVFGIYFGFSNDAEIAYIYEFRPKFVSEKFEKLLLFLHTCAPFLQDGSYVEMYGERECASQYLYSGASMCLRNEQWKYIFENGTMHEVQGNVVYKES